MAITHTLTNLGTGPTGAQIGATFSFTGNLEENFQQAVPSGTNTHYVMPSFTAASIQKVIIVSDVAAVIKVNSSSSPTQTITLLAGVPFQWFVGCGYTTTFPTTTTDWYITNATTANISMGLLLSV